MAQAVAYDYRELAFDNYAEAHALLRKLVALREMRGMRQEDLAAEMGVTQGYISQIENGHTGLLDRLNDYAIEVGARITYRVEEAELLPRGRRHAKLQLGKQRGSERIASTWSDGRRREVAASTWEV